MKGDFSRDTFDRRHRFSRVLMQQGRVLLDADWNEQASILLHYLRTLAADLIGPHGGPGRGFEIGCTRGDGLPLECDFTIGWGHYYVDGILAENVPPVRCPPGEDRPPLVTYTSQPDYPRKSNELLEIDADYLVYLDVWERHLTHLQGDYIREVALGGPDTATRTKLVWQVKVAKESECDCDDVDDEEVSCWDLLQAWVKDGPRCLRARARVPAPSDDPCVIPPEARYRGAENQLYRVEIHHPSNGNGNDAAKSGATFKWSRDNGSVVFAVRNIQGSTVTLDTMGPDQRRGLVEGDWVEVVDDFHVLRGVPGILARVDAVDRVEFEVILGLSDGAALPAFDEHRHPLLRRWDQGTDAIPVGAGKWIDLEDGVQVYFEPDGTYRTGDYWLIPARTATGDVLWPTEKGEDGAISPRALPPHGVEHHYAPLARISVDADGNVSCERDCRCTFHPPCAVVIDGIVTAAAAENPCQLRFTAELHGPEPLRYRWEFGDGTASNVVSPTHTYDASGNYRVRLTVTGDIGHDVRERWVHVEKCGDQPPPTDTPSSDAERIAALVRIKGVGEARARILLNAGRATPAAVAAMSVEEIESMLNVTETLATTIREGARVIAAERA